MKHLTTLLLTLLVLGGCGSTIIGVMPDDIEISEGWIEWEELYPSAVANGYPTYDLQKEAVGTSTKVFYKIDKKNQSIEFKSKGSIIYTKMDNSPCGSGFNFVSTELPKLCFNNFGGGIKELPRLENGSITCNFGMQPKARFGVIADENFIIPCNSEEDERLAKIELEKMESERLESLKALALENKKSKCRDYGFKDDTDGMGLCLIELDKLAKLEEQILAIEKRNNQVYLQNQQLIAEQKRQREAQALINLGAAISGAGAPRTNTPKVPITTYPNSFSSSLTVPSNQVCPILSTPITKQEIRGANRICYYQ